MDAVRTVTPFESVPAYQEVFKPWWDIPSKVTSIAITPLSYLASIFSSSAHQKKLPPCAQGHSLVGSWLELRDMNWDIIRLIISYSKEYGKEEGICKLKIGNQTFYIVMNPGMAKEILSDPESYTRGDSLRIWRKFSEGGLSEGEKTKKSRIQAIRFIGAHNLPKYFPGMMQIADTWVGNLSQKKSSDLFHAAERVALAVMGETFFLPVCGENPFGLDGSKDIISDLFLKTYSDLFQIITSRLTSALSSIPYVGDSLYSWKYPEEDRKIQECKDELKRILTPIFNKLFEKQGSEHAQKVFKDFEIDPNNVNLDEILDKSLGFLQASFETASKGLAWILYLLGKDQPFQDRLRAELLKRFADKKAESYQDLKEVSLLIKTIEEGLRLFTPFPFLLRDIVNPDNFSEYHVDKGGIFVISPLLIHHNAEVWEDPETFDPDRWTDEMLSDNWQVANPSYMIFLGGDHRCPGRFFAKQEIAIFLSNILLNHRVVLEDPSQIPQLKLNITLHAQNPVWAHLERL